MEWLLDIEPGALAALVAVTALPSAAAILAGLSAWRASSRAAASAAAAEMLAGRGRTGMTGMADLARKINDMAGIQTERLKTIEARVGTVAEAVTGPIDPQTDLYERLRADLSTIASTQRQLAAGIERLGQELADLKAEVIDEQTAKYAVNEAIMKAMGLKGADPVAGRRREGPQG